MTTPVELTAEEIALKLFDALISVESDHYMNTAHRACLDSVTIDGTVDLIAVAKILLPALSRNLMGLGGDGEFSVPKRKWKRADAMFRFLNYKKAVQEFNEWRAAGMPEKPAPSLTVPVPAEPEPRA